MAEMTVSNLLASLEDRMKKTEEALKVSFNAIRTGKASPALVEGLMVEYYGTPTRLRDIAAIAAPASTFSACSRQRRSSAVR